MDEPKKQQVVLVTGASGCLGQHIVKLLQEKDDTVKEIRLFDLLPYKNNLGHQETKPMKVIEGTVCSMKDLEEAFTGVDCVIHAAAKTATELIVNSAEIHEVNFEGTKNVIAACVKQNVPYLIYTSATDAITGSDAIYYGTESTVPVPKRFLLGTYAETKYKAEEMVLKANGKMLADGTRKLKTVAMRPTYFYGEQDANFITKVLRMAKEMRGILQRTSTAYSRFQITYVGNVAWAHIKAKEKMQVDDTCCGEAYFLTDDTPILEPFEIFKPYIQERGFEFSKRAIPDWIIIYGIMILGLILYFFPDYKKHYTVNLPSAGMVHYFNRTYFFNRLKATVRLDYEPIYSDEEVKDSVSEFYKNVKL